MRRENRVEYSATEAEYKKIAKAAEAAGIPVATYSRLAAIEKAAREEKKEEKQ